MTRTLRCLLPLLFGSLLPATVAAQAPAWRDLLAPFASARGGACRAEAPTAREVARGVRRVTVHDEGDRADPTNRTIRIYTDSSGAVVSAVVIASSHDASRGLHMMTTIVLTLDGAHPQALLLRTAGTIDAANGVADTPAVSEPTALEPEAVELGQRLIRSLRSATCAGGSAD